MLLITPQNMIIDLELPIFGLNIMVEQFDACMLYASNEVSIIVL